MSPRTGRPKLANPKSQRLEIRLHKETEDLLDECAQRMNASKTAVIEHGIRLVKNELDRTAE